MKISRIVKRNLLLKIKQVKFFSGKTVTMGTSTTTCVNLIFTFKFGLFPYILSLVEVKIIIMKMRWYLIPSRSI